MTPRPRWPRSRPGSRTRSTWTRSAMTWPVWCGRRWNPPISRSGPASPTGPAATRPTRLRVTWRLRSVPQEAAMMTAGSPADTRMMGVVHAALRRDLARVRLMLTAARGSAERLPVLLRRPVDVLALSSAEDVLEAELGFDRGVAAGQLLK